MASMRYWNDINRQKSVLGSIANAVGARYEPFAGPGKGITWSSPIKRMTGTIGPIEHLGGAGLTEHYIGRGLGLGFTAYGAYQGYKEEGIWGAYKGAASNIGMEIVGNLAQNEASRFIATRGYAGAAKAIGSAGRFTATRLLLPVMAASLVTSQMQKSWMYHMQKLPLETVGSTEAFQTRGAATMRQRSMMSIQRSYLNARSAFGTEAQYQHISSVRGGPRRYTNSRY